MDPNPSTILGIDVSKATFDVALLQPGRDRPSHCASFDNHSKGFAKLLQWLKARSDGAPLLAAVEATGSDGYRLMHFLYDKDFAVAELNPRRVKDFARAQGKRVKTDALDATIIAAFARAIPPRIWEPASDELRELQQLMRRRDQLINTRTALSNSYQSEDARGTSLKAIVQRSRQRELKAVERELDTIETALHRCVQDCPKLRKAVQLLKSIPGVGFTVAAALLAEMPLLAGFSKARQAAAFAGLTPALEQSGTSVRRRGRITKQGSAFLRKQLYMAALAATRNGSPLNSCYQALVERGKPRLCALVAMMNKILRLAYGVLKHQTPFDLKYATKGA